MRPTLAVPAAQLNANALDLLAIEVGKMRLRWVELEHQPYLAHHRETVFRAEPMKLSDSK